jgi:hypothetical protein
MKTNVHFSTLKRLRADSPNYLCYHGYPRRPHTGNPQSLGDVWEYLIMTPSTCLTDSRHPAHSNVVDVDNRDVICIVCKGQR